MDALLVLVAALLVVRVLLSLVLDFLNQSEIREHAAAVPSALEGKIDEETYRKSVNYSLAKNRFSSVTHLWDAVVLAVVLFSGLLPWLFVQGENLVGGSVWASALILFAIMLLVGIPDLPFEWWLTFHLEARFGFNKMTPGLWITDKLKGLLISAVLVYPLICILLWLVRQPLWWFWAFAVFFGFQLLMLVVFPTWIMPLFNKFSPLEDGELRSRLMSLAERTGFKAKTILIMDGSKRSGHSNAFFAGLGRFRRIVLFDTLVEQLREEELEAVLAHEIGHYKMGHIPKTLIFSAIASFGAFALLGWLANSPWFVEAFGFAYQEGQLAPVLLLFGLLAGLFTFWLTPLFAMRSRKHEYEADAFAKRAMQGNPEPLQEALVKLHTKNLGNLKPHPLYSAFYYSHPTLLERLSALRSDKV